jgi:hypothetical protein
LPDTRPLHGQSADACHRVMGSRHGLLPRRIHRLGTCAVDEIFTHTTQPIDHGTMCIPAHGTDQHSLKLFRPGHTYVTARATFCAGLLSQRRYACVASRSPRYLSDRGHPARSASLEIRIARAGIFQQRGRRSADREPTASLPFLWYRVTVVFGPSDTLVGVPGRYKYRPPLGLS